MLRKWIRPTVGRVICEKENEKQRNNLRTDRELVWANKREDSCHADGVAHVDDVDYVPPVSTPCC